MVSIKFSARMEMVSTEFSARMEMVSIEFSARMEMVHRKKLEVVQTGKLYYYTIAILVKSEKSVP